MKIKHHRTSYTSPKSFEWTREFVPPVFMISKSIKWRLQIWYGLILVVVLAGFGFTAYQLERGRHVRPH